METLNTLQTDIVVQEDVKPLPVKPTEESGVKNPPPIKS